MIARTTSRRSGSRSRWPGPVGVVWLVFACERSGPPRPSTTETQQPSPSALSGTPGPGRQGSITRPPVVVPVPHEGTEVYVLYCGDDCYSPKRVTESDVELMGVRCVLSAEQVRGAMNAVNEAEVITRSRVVRECHVSRQLAESASALSEGREAVTVPGPKEGVVGGCDAWLKMLSNGSTVPEDVVVDVDGLVHMGGAFRRIPVDAFQVLWERATKTCPWEEYSELRERGRTYPGPLFPRASEVHDRKQ